MLDWIRDLTSAEDIQDWVKAHPERQNRESITELHLAVLETVHVDRGATLRMADAALALGRAGDDAESLALASRIAGNALYANDQYESAIERYSEALSLFESLGYEAPGNEAEIGRTLSSALQSLGYLGRYEQALAWSSRARRIFEKSGDELRLARLNSNTGNLLFRQDRHEEAIVLYERALASFRAVGEPGDVAATLSNVAVCRTSMGQFRAALEAYEAAREHCEIHGFQLLVAGADYNIAWLYYLRGDYLSAMDLYARSRKHCAQVGDRYHLALCDLDEAEMYLELNLVAESGELARRAAEQFAALGMTYEQARALVTQALAQADPRGMRISSRLFRRARELFLAQDNRVWPAVIDLYESMLARRRGNARRALFLCRRAGRVLSATPLPGKDTLCDLVESQLLADRGELLRARELSLAALGRLELSETRGHRVAAYSLLARIEEVAGRERAAFGFWERARHEIETLRSRLWGESLRISFLKDKLAVYESLARIYLNRGDAEGALSAIQQAKSRSMVETMAAIGAVSRHAPDADAEEARRDLNADYRQLELAGLRKGEASASRALDLRQRIHRREEEIVRLVTATRHADPASSPEFDAARLCASAPPGTQLIEYFEIRGVLHACLIHAGGIQTFALTETARIRTPLQYLQLQIARVRAAGSEAERITAASARTARSHLAELYDALIRPLQGSLEGFSHLVVMPCGILHEAPFHAFFDGEQHLIDRYVVSFAPSASVFALCMSRPASQRTGSLVMGIPDEAAPEIEAEARAVAEVTGARLLLGERATAAELRQSGPESRLVHIATHGLFRRDNPLFSAILLGDSRLSALDLYRLSLDADLVTLSGCSTGVNAVVGGDELMGLIRGVLYAGARSVLASLWDVHDRSTTEFMRLFYGHLIAGSPPAEAVRNSLIAVREKWPHPYYWAPFLLVGSPL